jgi:hypothetical protein
MAKRRRIPLISARSSAVRPPGVLALPEKLLDALEGEGQALERDVRTVVLDVARHLGEDLERASLERWAARVASRLARPASGAGNRTHRR